MRWSKPIETPLHLQVVHGQEHTWSFTISPIIIAFCNNASNKHITLIQVQQGTILLPPLPTRNGSLLSLLLSFYRSLHVFLVGKLKVLMIITVQRTHWNPVIILDKKEQPCSNPGHRPCEIYPQPPVATADVLGLVFDYFVWDVFYSFHFFLFFYLLILIIPTPKKKKPHPHRYSNRCTRYHRQQTNLFRKEPRSNQQAFSAVLKKRFRPSFSLRELSSQNASLPLGTQRKYSNFGRHRGEFKLACDANKYHDRVWPFRSLAP